MKHENLNVFIIHCASPCGTYIQPYCKDLVVIAETKEQAFALAEEDPTIRYVEGAQPKIIGQYKIEEGVVHAHFAKD